MVQQNTEIFKDRFACLLPKEVETFKKTNHLNVNIRIVSSVLS